MYQRPWWQRELIGGTRGEGQKNITRALRCWTNLLDTKVRTLWCCVGSEIVFHLLKELHDKAIRDRHVQVCLVHLLIGCGAWPMSAFKKSRDQYIHLVSLLWYSLPGRSWNQALFCIHQEAFASALYIWSRFLCGLCLILVVLSMNDTIELQHHNICSALIHLLLCVHYSSTNVQYINIYSLFTSGNYLLQLSFESNEHVKIWTNGI